jgi:hypothetical protein
MLSFYFVCCVFFFGLSFIVSCCCSFVQVHQLSFVPIEFGFILFFNELFALAGVSPFVIL